jgi:quercetin dioxygenase-like cupin family protein
MKFIAMDETQKGKVMDWEDGAVVHLKLDKGQKIPPHHTNHTTLVVIRKGHVLFTVEENTKQLIPGTLLLMEPNEEHSLEALEDSSIFVIKMGTKDPKNCLDK